MKYRDLIHFEPIIEVVQLRQADQFSYAEQMVSTFVLSDRMADILLNRILPLLRLDSDQPGFGVLVVGNYGTGKSHLMSVLTSVAEHSNLNQKLTNTSVADGFVEIAGKYKVARQETGATDMPLRDLVLKQLEVQLAAMEVEYHFPSMSDSPNNKDPILEMMSVFHKKYPEQGLLIAIDELLDYLRARKDRELIQDLNFLREIGEVCAQSKLRFIAGIQESLFDSPHFQFAAESIKRVKARFDQVRIVREDVAYVVSRRLLGKTPQQKKSIKEYLLLFSKLYESMSAHLDAFVELFPVHPAYLEVFENVDVVEKRDLLKALSKQMKDLLDQDLPENSPGLISFDSYWQVLTDDPAYRATTEVREIQERTKVLEGKIQSLLNPPEYRAAALRIISALAIHRMTVHDLYSTLGLTPKELRDQLCLYLPLPEVEADFLQTSINAVLQEISKVVGGQFISHNSENDQYFLDLKKDIDYEAQIEQMIGTLDENRMDRYYFILVARALELTESSYVPGFHIWPREIPWPGHGVTRQGYFFLGAPNERSTAQPPRDFYLHFPAIYGNNKEDVDSKEDELFFILANKDEKFIDLLKHFAGAREMSLLSVNSSQAQGQYDRKADESLRGMVGWLRENLVHAFQVKIAGNIYSLPDILSQYHLNIQSLAFRDEVFRVASALLEDCFNKKYQAYPVFSGVDWTAETIPQAAIAAIRAIAGLALTRPAQGALEGLKLAQGENGKLLFTTDQSPYSQHILKRLRDLPSGKVLNRGDLIQGVSGAEKDSQFGLEPELFMVVLVALVRQGDIVINLRGRTLDSSNLEEVIRIPIEDLVQFSSIGFPRQMPIQALQVLFEGLDIPPSLLRDAAQFEIALQSLKATTWQELERVTRVLENLRSGFRYWRESIFSQQEAQAIRGELTIYKDFMESLQNITTPGQLRNFSLSQTEIRNLLKTRDQLKLLTQVEHTLDDLKPSIEYLYQAELSLPASHPWKSDLQKTIDDQQRLLLDKNERLKETLTARITGGLDNLKSNYAQAYLALHQLARLNGEQDKRKQVLAADPRWVQLRALAGLEFLQRNELVKLEDHLGRLRSCPGITVADLREHHLCSACGFLPSIETELKPAYNELEKAENDFDNLCQRWINALRANLQSEQIKENIQLLDEVERQMIIDFTTSGQLPDHISDRFIAALRDALQGLEKVTITSSDLLLTLTKPGMPCTVDEFTQRFQDLVHESIKGIDPHKVRIEIDW